MVVVSRNPSPIQTVALSPTTRLRETCVMLPTSQAQRRSVAESAVGGLAFAVLIARTPSTVAPSFVRMRRAVHFAVVLSLGAAKTGFATLIFMHLIRNSAQT